MKTTLRYLFLGAKERDDLLASQASRITNVTEQAFVAGIAVADAAIMLAANVLTTLIEQHLGLEEKAETLRLLEAKVNGVDAPGTVYGIFWGAFCQAEMLAISDGVDPYRITTFVTEVVGALRGISFDERSAHRLASSVTELCNFASTDALGSPRPVDPSASRI
jgi:hypothetical protein